MALEVRPRGLLAPAMMAIAVLLGAATCQGPTPRTSLAAVEVAFTAAERGAEAYVRLPACGTTSLAVCSQTSVVVAISKSRATARSAILGARLLVDSRAATPAQIMGAVSAAKAALDDLQTLVPLQVSP